MGMEYETKLYVYHGHLKRFAMYKTGSRSSLPGIPGVRRWMDKVRQTAYYVPLAGHDSVRSVFRQDKMRFWCAIVIHGWIDNIAAFGAISAAAASLHECDGSQRTALFCQPARRLPPHHARKNVRIKEITVSGFSCCTQCPAPATRWQPRICVQAAACMRSIAPWV
jgi:hypothetical protein